MDQGQFFCCFKTQSRNLKELDCIGIGLHSPHFCNWGIFQIFRTKRSKSNADGSLVPDMPSNNRHILTEALLALATLANFLSTGASLSGTSRRRARRYRRCYELQQERGLADWFIRNMRLGDGVRSMVFFACLQWNLNSFLI